MNIFNLITTFSPQITLEAAAAAAKLIYLKSSTILSLLLAGLTNTPLPIGIQKSFWKTESFCLKPK